MAEKHGSQRERLETVFAGGRPDRTPILGGWIACPRHICSLAGITEEQYWQSPVASSVRAYQVLGADGLVDVFVPKGKDDFRCVDASDYNRADSGMTLEEAVAAVDAMPSPDEVEARFDFPAEYAAYRQGLVERQALCGDVVWMPANWNAGARLVWYEDFGYENFFLLLGLHPERARKLIAVGGAHRLVPGTPRRARGGGRAVPPRAAVRGGHLHAARADDLHRVHAPVLRPGPGPRARTAARARGAGPCGTPTGTCGRWWTCSSTAGSRVSRGSSRSAA